MEHIGQNDDAKSNDQRVKKGMTAKKKSKKAKEIIEIVNNTSITNIEDSEDLIKEFKDKVSLHSNNGLTNGVSGDHATSDDQNNSKNGEKEPVSKCERLVSEKTDVSRSDKLEDRLSEVMSETAIEEPAKSDEIEVVSSTVLCPECKDESCTSPDAIEFESYRSELQMAEIMRLIQKDLSEPYSIYTYRYFIHNWPKLCFLAMHNNRCIGAIVCKLDLHRKKVKRGYIAMLAVDEKYRKRKIGSHLVKQAISVSSTLYIYIIISSGQCQSSEFAFLPVFSKFTSKFRFKRSIHCQKVNVKSSKITDIRAWKTPEQNTNNALQTNYAIPKLAICKKKH